MIKKEIFWAIVCGVAAVLGVIVGIYTMFFMHQEASKGLEVTLLSRSQLLNPDVHGPSELKLQYKGQDIPDVGILQIRFRSSGRQPILKADIAQPLKVTVSGMDRIISASIVGKDPHDLDVSTSIKGPDVEIDTSLLNPNDWFTVEIDGVTAFGKRADVYDIGGRVAGIERIAFLRSVPESSERKTPAWESIYGIVLTILTTVLGGLSALLGYRSRRND